MGAGTSAVRRCAWDKVAICGGHMIDAPDREVPRFPVAKSEAVRARIGHQLDRWKIGADDLAICGGASGSDILFAEECLRRGASLRLLLAQEMENFVRISVQPAGSGWVDRFYALRKYAEIATLPAPGDEAPRDVSIYARTNIWIINTARAEAAGSAKIYALLVWDEKPTGDGPGGTSDFERRVRDLGGLTEIINPTSMP